MATIDGKVIQTCRASLRKSGEWNSERNPNGQFLFITNGEANIGTTCRAF